MFGNYSGCGWIAGSSTATSTDATPQCTAGSIGYNLNEFALASNYNAKNAPGNDCNKSSVAPYNCTDGSTTSTNKACAVWANFRPWASGQSVSDQIFNSAMPSGILPSGAVVKWRYVGKYPTTGNIYYVMIKLANSYGVTQGYGNWGFINVNCLSALPYYTAA